MAALLEKLRRVFYHRYTPFFLPVVASLVFIGLVILAIPESLEPSSSDAHVDDEDASTEVTAAPATPAQDGATEAASRRARLANRAARKIKARVAGTPAGAAAPPVPAPVPASPDGAE